MNFLAVLTAYLAFIVSAEGIKFYLKPNTQKCLREELKKDVLIVGEFEVSPAPDQKVDYVVTDTKHAILAQNSDISKGKFSFVADSEDLYEICFSSKAFQKEHAVPQTVTLDTKRGVEARTYENLAEAAKLKPMEVELKKLEKLSDAIVTDFVDMREREKLMRDTNESTNSRVLYLSIFSLVCLLGLAIWQVTYLRRYFKAKKLIE